MFSYTVLFITPTCFGHSCDHLQGVVQKEYKQYVSDYIKCVRKIFYDYCQLYSSQHPIVKYHKIFQNIVKWDP